MPIQFYIKLWDAPLDFKGLGSFLRKKKFLSPVVTIKNVASFDRNQICFGIFSPKKPDLLPRYGKK